jgi:hypothetical protein
LTSSFIWCLTRELMPVQILTDFYFNSDKFWQIRYAGFTYCRLQIKNVRCICVSVEFFFLNFWFWKFITPLGMIIMDSNFAGRFQLSKMETYNFRGTILLKNWGKVFGFQIFATMPKCRNDLQITTGIQKISNLSFFPDNAK